MTMSGCPVGAVHNGQCCIFGYDPQTGLCLAPSCKLRHRIRSKKRDLHVAQPHELSSIIERETLLTGAEAARFILGGGRFERDDGAMVHDSEYWEEMQAVQRHYDHHGLLGINSSNEDLAADLALVGRISS